MNEITLNSGAVMPMLGFGTWDLRGRQCEEAVECAVNEGFRLLDTAQMYENEEAVGNAVRRCGIPRSELFVTTKLYRTCAGVESARKGIEASLRRLKLDFIDLVLIHEPYSQSLEMYQALKEACLAGKIRSIGVSNFSEQVYTSFLRKCEIVPAVNQVESHVYFPQRNLQRLLLKHGTHMQAWAPFTEGRRRIFDEPILIDIGRTHEKSAAQVALRYLLQLGISVIPKSVSLEHIRENADIFSFSLSEPEMMQLEALDGGKSLFGWY